MIFGMELNTVLKLVMFFLIFALLIAAIILINSSNAPAVDIGIR
jgi:hypothetical protein